jgi:hypothetical protein
MTVLNEPSCRIPLLMGRTPNAISALLRRARNGLRIAHLSAAAEDRELLPDRRPGT